MTAEKELNLDYLFHKGFYISIAKVANFYTVLLSMLYLT